MIVAGFGFRAAASMDSLSSALRATGYTGKIPCIATAADKAQHPALITLAETCGQTIHSVTPEALEGAETKTHSDISRTVRNTGSLAEAAALAAAGPGATLLVSRQISEDRMATCAIAQGPNL